ncbi:unnamed protein product [Closterium sp. NIES-65]|nr:unnamed protein product [Closterium sp. NIES-65]
MLEIGLKYGDSLKLWKRAFPRGRIYGIDNGVISKALAQTRSRRSTMQRRGTRGCVSSLPPRPVHHTPMPHPLCLSWMQKHQAEARDPQKHQAEARDPRVRLMVGNQANGTFLEQVVAEIKSAVGLLDFIVDDGGHTMDQQQTSLKHLLPLVKVP